MSNTKAHLHFCFLMALFFPAVTPAIAQTNAASTVSELQAQLRAHVTDARFDGALWGVKIVSLDTGKTVFEYHADRLMSPASNSKLYTGALALDRLGPEYRIVTPILASKRPNFRGTLHGDLVIAGRADPSWNIRHAGLNFWDLFAPFVTAIKKAGVRRITGDLIGDATFLRSPPNGSGWAASDLEDYYGAEISALTLDDNYTQIAAKPAAKPGEPCILAVVDPCTGLKLDNHTTTTLTNVAKHLEAHRFPGEKIVHVFGNLPVGSEPAMIDMPVPRPAEWFAAGLKEALRRNGIKVHGAARAVYWPSPAPRAAAKLGEVVSPPLRELIRDFMKPSQNLEADLIFEHTGEMSRSTNSPSWQTSENCALNALHDFFANNGLPADEVHFDEGSGLSRNNLTTANATVSMLQFMSKHRAGKDLIAALPVAGVDGTLRRRMRDTPAAQNVHAKTGTLRWASSLSGLVTTAAGEHLAFGLMLNRYAAPRDYRKSSDLDDIAVALARFSGHVEEPLADEFAPFGDLIVTQFVNAPFPHPARANGHTYHGEFYSAQEHYSNSTVAMFIPRGFRPTNKVDFIVHFHGWRHEVAGTLEQYQLIQQLAASGKNAVLIVPQGPYMAPDSFGGKLEDTNGFAAFMGEAVEKLRASGALGRSDFQIGKIILSCHSGGYEVVAAILDHGGLQGKIPEVWLFDALYAGTENFVAWQKSQRGRFLDVYTDHGGTREETENLMAAYKSKGADLLTGEEGAGGVEALRTNKLVFLHSDLPHDDVVASRRTFEQFIQSSCLQNK